MVAETFQSYIGRISKASINVNQEHLDRLLDVLVNSGANSRIFVCGNGGSASTAEYFSADFGTGSRRIGRGLAVTCLSSNTSILTQIANDLDYSNIFAAQIELEAKEGDLLVVFTASGNSPNVISAISQASRQGLTTVAFTGFDSGTVKERADISIHVETSIGEYGVVEDIHLSLTHYLAERFRIAVAPSSENMSVPLHDLIKARPIGSLRSNQREN